MTRDIPNVRPWGLYDDVFHQSVDLDWSFVGCVSMEDRCTAAYKKLAENGSVTKALVFSISDAQSRFTDEVKRKTDDNKAIFLKNGLNESSISERHICGKDGLYISDIDRFLSDKLSENIFIDITCLPKKYFFILIKRCLALSEYHKNIFVCYSQPDTYGGVKLAENHESWTELPGFMAPRVEPDKKLLVIGVGFEPLGLPAMYSTGLFNRSDKHFLFPFPSQNSSVGRNWEFLRALEPVQNDLGDRIRVVDALDVPTIFNTLNRLTDNGELFSTIAPFGPKTMSLAMCLFACVHQSNSYPPSVFYTQPTVYNPEYSSGVSVIGGKDCIYTYPIRINGTNLYS